MTTTIFDIVKDLVISGGLITLIIFLIQRRDTRKSEENRIYKELQDLKRQSDNRDDKLEKRFKKLEKDMVRTQLLLLMYNYRPEDEQELMQVAEHYFVDLEANWYLTPKFNRFLKKEGLARPEWLKK